MAKLKMEGKLLNYNNNNNILSIKLDVLDPDLQENLEYILENYDKYLKMTINYNIKDSIKDQLRKKWYASIKTILMYNDIVPNSENMKEYDVELRESIFPVKDSELLQPKRMRDMTTEELQNSINILIQRYPECNL
jgi:hypothetical protein